MLPSPPSQLLETFRQRDRFGLGGGIGACRVKDEVVETAHATESRQEVGDSAPIATPNENGVPGDPIAPGRLRMSDEEHREVIERVGQADNVGIHASW